MKNFRKVLALILVVATLFSFVAMASAKEASEYADYAEITNVIPVEVISALGITEGYDGKYHPADTIDRDEVAAMIARLRNGGKFDAALYVGAPNVFADVKGQWSEGYVTYCSQLGIINGLNETTFNPDGKITVVDTLKLLLCVLGYDAKLSGYVGPNYKVAVVRDADKMGLTDGIASADMFKEATRDQVALMFFNALKARLVYGYVSENIVTITNSLLGTEFYEGITSVTLPALTNAEVAYCNAVISNKTLGNVLNVWDEPARDCFGRPGTTWHVGNWKKFFVKAPDAVTVDGTNPFAKPADITAVYHNGEQKQVFAATDLGRGVQAEKYGTELVLIDTFMGVVTDINYRRNEVQINDIGWVKNTMGAAVEDIVMYHECDGTCVAADARIDADKVEVDAHSGLYVHANAFTVVKPVEVGVVNCFYNPTNASKSKIDTADKEYFYSKNLGHDVALGLDIMGVAEKNTTKWLYLDEHGYIQYWCAPKTEPAATEFRYYVENTNKFSTTHQGGNEDDLNKHNYVYTADYVDMKGEYHAEQAASEAIYEKLRGDADNYEQGFFAAHTAAGLKWAEFADQDSYLDAANGEIVGEPWANGLNYHANADTQYLIREYDFASGKYVYSTGLGYKDIAEYVGKNRIGDNVVYNAFQYFDLDEDGIVEAMFVDAFYKKISAEYVYIKGLEMHCAIGALGNKFPAFDLYNAWINGAEAFVAYYNIDADQIDGNLSSVALDANTLYQTSMQAVNATYKDKPIYVALDEAYEVDLTEYYEFDEIRVEAGQIGLYDDGACIERLAAEYNDKLTVYVFNGDGAGTYTGTEFVKKFYPGEWNTGLALGEYSVYALGAPINTLIVEIMN